MTEIGLLITGVLSAKPPYLPNSLEQQSFPLENGVQESTSSRLSQSVPTKQITPPEFIQTDAQPTSITSKGEIKTVKLYQRLYSQPLPVLRFGSSGTSVRVLQKLLVSKGYVIRIDGAFGPLTEIALKGFQKRQNLQVDGIVGQKTWYQLTI